MESSFSSFPFSHSSSISVHIFSNFRIRLENLQENRRGSQNQKYVPDVSNLPHAVKTRRILHCFIRHPIPRLGHQTNRPGIRTYNRRLTYSRHHPGTCSVRRPSRRQDNRTYRYLTPQMWLFAFSALMTLSYFCFKLVRILTNDSDQYSDTRNYLLLFVGISLIVVGSTLGVSVACYRNFGRGLKPYSKSMLVG
jgi:hypothetical protein